MIASSSNIVHAQADGESSEDGQDEGGSFEVRQSVDIRAQEQLERGESLIRRGEQISRRVSLMLNESRREQDIIRVTCLNDKLAQINANRQAIRARQESLRTAIDQGGDQRNHHFTILSVLAQKLDVLEQEANQCIGTDLYDTGATQVTTSVDPSTPAERPGTVAGPPSVAIPFIPPPESPSM
ncbi:MAG: hypothetical protein AAF355_02965 [Myxococcota bacterium]